MLTEVSQCTRKQVKTMNTDKIAMNGQESDNIVTAMAQSIQSGRADWKYYHQAIRALKRLGMEHRQPPIDLVNEELKQLSCNERLIELSLEKTYTKSGEEYIFIHHLTIQRLETDDDVVEPFVVLEYRLS